MNSTNSCFPSSIFHIIRQYVGPHPIVAELASGVSKSFDFLSIQFRMDVQDDGSIDQIHDVEPKDKINKIVAWGELRYKTCQIAGMTLQTATFPAIGSFWTVRDLIDLIWHSEERFRKDYGADQRHRYFEGLDIKKDDKGIIELHAWVGS